MIIGIDATNIRAGGVATHLREILRSANPELYGVSKVVLWGCKSILDGLVERPWIRKIHKDVFEHHYLKRAIWQTFHLGGMAQAEGCDLLFVPGGTFITKSLPVVTMSRNMLPFEWNELVRYGIARTTLRLLMLRWSQSRSFKAASGTIFLTRYALESVKRVTGGFVGASVIIPHGVDERFFNAPRPQRSMCEYSLANPFYLLYVSAIDAYKHQWCVAEAVAALRAAGYPLIIDFIGEGLDRPSLKRLQSAIIRLDPDGSFMRYLGPIPHKEIHSFYQAADLSIFASSCENMPNIILESMASGLPIACSDRGPMPEVLADAGAYFDPERPATIIIAIKTLLDSAALRHSMAEIAFRRAQAYSWVKCSNDTFKFMQQIMVACLTNRAREKINRK